MNTNKILQETAEEQNYSNTTNDESDKYCYLDDDLNKISCFTLDAKSC